MDRVQQLVNEIRAAAMHERQLAIGGARRERLIEARRKLLELHSRLATEIKAVPLRRLAAMEAELIRAAPGRRALLEREIALVRLDLCRLDLDRQIETLLSKG